MQESLIHVQDVLRGGPTLKYKLASGTGADIYLGRISPSCPERLCDWLQPLSDDL